MSIWEKFGLYRKTEIEVDKRCFSVVISPVDLSSDSEGNIVGALANDNKTFIYLVHKSAGYIKIPQFSEPIVPGSLACDDRGNPTFGMTKDGRWITLDGTLVATSERGDKILSPPDLRTQDYLQHDGKLLLHLEQPVYVASIRLKWGMPSHALAKDNQTVFFFKEKSYYVIPEADLEKLLEK